MCSPRAGDPLNEPPNGPNRLPSGVLGEPQTDEPSDEPNRLWSGVPGESLGVLSDKLSSGERGTKVRGVELLLFAVA